MTLIKISDEEMNNTNQKITKKNYSYIKNNTMNKTKKTLTAVVEAYIIKQTKIYT